MIFNLDGLKGALRKEEEKKEQGLEVFLLTLDIAKAGDGSAGESRDKDIWSLTAPAILERGSSPRETKGDSLDVLEKALEDLGSAAEKSERQDFEHFFVVHQWSQNERSRDKDIWSLNGSLPPSSVVEMFLTSRHVPDFNPPQGEQCRTQARDVAASAIAN